LGGGAADWRQPLEHNSCCAPPPPPFPPAPLRPAPATRLHMFRGELGDKPSCPAPCSTSPCSWTDGCHPCCCCCWVWCWAVAGGGHTLTPPPSPHACHASMPPCCNTDQVWRVRCGHSRGDVWHPIHPLLQGSGRAACRGRPRHCRLLPVPSEVQRSGGSGQTAGGMGCATGQRTAYRLAGCAGWLWGWCTRWAWSPGRYLPPAAVSWPTCCVLPLWVGTWHGVARAG
jgi:hypothetical protein